MASAMRYFRHIRVRPRFQRKTIVSDFSEYIKPNGISNCLPVCECLSNMFARPWTTCFGQHEPAKVLVAYILYESKAFADTGAAARVKIRFTFDIFARKLLTVPQFLAIVSEFGEQVQTAARVLVDACTCPGNLARGPLTRTWSANETVLLLAGAFLSQGNGLERYLAHRPSYDSWKKRVSRVIAELSEHNMLDGHGVILDVMHCDDLTVAPEDGRKTKNRSSNKHLLLAQEVTTMRRLASTQEARHSKQVHSLNEKIRSLEDMENDDMPDEQAALSETLLREWKELLPIHSNGRRYTDHMYEISELLRATSRKSFRILRQIVPVPSESALFRRYGETIRENKDLLTREELLEQHIEDMLSKERAGPATIGIDAFSFRTFASQTLSDGNQQSEQYSNAFLFIHIPLDSAFSPKVIHIYKKGNGAYDSNVQSLFDRIRAKYHKEKSYLWFKSTDGDRYLSYEHDVFFQTYVEPHKDDFSFLLQCLHDKLRGGVTMPISDPLHFAKNMRGKIIDHCVALVDSEIMVSLVDRISLEKILELGDVLNDLSQLGRMRDVYVTKLFSLRNVSKLLAARHYAGALVLLPYASLFTVLYGKNLSLETRMFFTKLAYLCFNRLLTEATKLTTRYGCIRSRYSSGCLAISMAEPGYIKRMMHTSLAIGIAMLFGPDKLRLDALGTHIVENAIGIARSISNSTKYESICSAFTTAELRKQLTKKYGITLYIPKRINDGGAKIDTVCEGGIQHPEQWDAHDIVSACVEVCAFETRQACEQEVLKFGQELSNFLCKLEIQELQETSEIANALIVQRNYKFKTTGIVEHAEDE